MLWAWSTTEDSIWAILNREKWQFIHECREKFNQKLYAVTELQAEMVPTGTPPINQYSVHSLWDVSFTHPYADTLSMQSFSYTSWLKWCLQGPPPANQCSVHSEWDFSLTHPGWNGTYGELLPQTHTQYAPMGSISKHIQAQMTSRGNSSHELKLR